MELYCRRCTRAETIKGDMEAAKAAGWQVDSWPEGDQFVCRRCTPKVYRRTEVTVTDELWDATARDIREIVDREWRPMSAYDI